MLEGCQVVRGCALFRVDLDRCPTVSDNQSVSAKGPVLYTFVESVVFTKQLQELASIETLYAIQADLVG
jgi:hypothetical protein